MEFSYDTQSDIGPENWGSIAIDDNECNGDQQSPIDIAVHSCTDTGRLAFTPGSCQAEFVLNPHNVQANYRVALDADDASCQPGNLVTPEGQAYQLVQFHAHLSSEHTINGQHTFGEFHMVHKSNSGEIAVLALWMEIGATQHATFQTLLDGWQSIQTATDALCEGETTTQDDAPILKNIYNLIPTHSEDYYQYYGSLTTPPCTEQVLWLLFAQPLVLSTQQANQLQSLILDYRDPQSCDYATVASPNGTTNRPTTFPLNGRTIHHVCARHRWGQVSTLALGLALLVGSALGVWFCSTRTTISSRHRKRASYRAIA